MKEFMAGNYFAVGAVIVAASLPCPSPDNRKLVLSEANASAIEDPEVHAFTLTVYCLPSAFF